MRFRNSVLGACPPGGRRYLLAVLLLFAFLGSISRVERSTKERLLSFTSQYVGSGLDTSHNDSDMTRFSVLNGSPTPDFRDNLVPNVNYITTWISSGWTNDVMTYINLIYMGLITNRIPIVPMFLPTHVGFKGPSIDFGEVFDVPRIRAEMRRPLLEWREVKNLSANATQTLGCWNTWEAVQQAEKRPRDSFVPVRLGLDISYSVTPAWIKAFPFDNDRHARFSSLAALGFPEGHVDHAINPVESPRNHVKLPPDMHLLCFDYLYYVCESKEYEMGAGYSPAWLLVGRYMHWAPKLKAISMHYIRETLEVDPTAEIPPWIGIHIRHGDFTNSCKVPLEDCLAPISAIARRVEEVKQEILERKGVHVRHVIMTSDEKNETWWHAVSLQNWYRINGSAVADRHGVWYPVLVDAVVQSCGLGFVGTDGSTMSQLAGRRVQSWNNGSVRFIKWGFLGADDH